MSWGTVAGVAVLTTVVGGCTGAALAACLIKWLQISSFEGGSGYFFFFVTLFSTGAGFVIGLVTAAIVRSGFWAAQGWATGIVAGLAIVTAVLAVATQDNGPRLDGDKVVLEVQLKCPRGWKPDNYGRSELGSGFWLYRTSDTSNGAAMVLGGLTFAPAPEFDGQWVVSCAVDLDTTRSSRSVNIHVGHQTDLSFQVPLPRHPGPQFTQWSAWKAAAPAYDFRFRIQRHGDYQKAHPDPQAAFLAERAKSLESVAADAPLTKWLPFFENLGGDSIAYQQCAHPEVEAVNARPDELAPLLRSRDNAVARRAVFAAATLTQIPPSLSEPLTVSGRHTLDLIHQARAQSLPNDPDLVAEEDAYTFFHYWNDAMEKAGAAAAAAHRAVLEEIDREIHGDPGPGRIQLIAKMVSDELEKPGKQ